MTLEECTDKRQVLITLTLHSTKAPATLQNILLIVKHVSISKKNQPFKDKRGREGKIACLNDYKSRDQISTDENYFLSFIYQTD